MERLGTAPPVVGEFGKDGDDLCLCIATLPDGDAWWTVMQSGVGAIPLTRLVDAFSEGAPLSLTDHSAT